MPADSGVTVVTMLVCSFIFAREAAGATSARHSLRPLIGEGRMLAQLVRITLQDREAVAAGHTGCLKCEAVAAPRLSFPVRGDDTKRLYPGVNSPVTSFVYTLPTISPSPSEGVE